jgi:hypothetical protein
MASIIRIKRSSVSGNPSTLGAGEIAYSALADNGANGGDRLYIGMGTETAGNAANHIVIGGKYFTDKLDHTPGILTASSALIVDSSSKLDNLKVDNLDLNGNTLSTTNTNGDLILSPNGTGLISLLGDTEVNGDLTVSGTINATITGNSATATKWTTPRDLSLTGDATATLNDVDGSADVSAILTLATVNTNVGTYGSATSIPVVTVNAKGLVTGVTTASISTALSIAADTGTTDSVSLGTDTLTFTGGEGIDTQVSDNTITISAEDATSSNKGIASFNVTDFTVSSGAVTLNQERVEDIVGGMVSTNTESGISVEYDDVNGKLDFNVNDPVITIAGDVDGFATMTNLGDTTITVALDNVNSNVGSFGSTTKIPAFTVNSKGLVTAASEVDVATTFSIAGDTGSDTISLLSDTLTFTGGEGIDVAVTNNTITVSGELASTTNIGSASFNSNSFSVASGAVSIKAGGVTNSQLVNSDVTIGSTTVALGATSTSLAGITELTVDNLNINGNEIQTTNANGDIVLNPNGTGDVDVSGAHITNLAEPVNATDAATKNYVDNAVSGLNWKTAVNLYAESNVALTGSTSTLVIDGHAALDSTDNNVYRLLLTGQSTASENGIYVYTDNGTSYALVRATDADAYTELVGASVWILEGVDYANTGWTQSNHYLSDFTGQTWVQFSGAGAYLAGAGLGQTGTEFFVNVATSGGIEIVSDSLQLKSTLAGDGLTYDSGVLAIGGTTDRISVTADAIDISSNYVGQSSITTLGTISTGVWEGQAIADAYVADDLTISGGTINNTPIGAAVRNTALFTTIGADSTVTLSDSTESTTTSSGALQVAGGVGIAKSIVVGANITGAGAGTSTLDGFNIDGGTY